MIPSLSVTEAINQAPRASGGNDFSMLAETLKEKLKTELAKAHFIGVMTDESCDIAIYKKLII